MGGSAGGGLESAESPGEWRRVERRFRDGHTERWWALEAERGPYGSGRRLRAVVATTDPNELPEPSTWYLLTNLPSPGSEQARDSGVEPADLAEIARLYGLRMWVEQSYKQTKHALGWDQYQVRGDIAIRRHWQLVCCAFSFCWWHQRHCEPVIAEVAGGGENKRRTRAEPAGSIVAGGAEEGAGVAGAVGNAVAILEGLVEASPASTVADAA